MIGLFTEFKDGSISLHEEKPIRTLDKFPPACIEFVSYSDGDVRAVNFEPKAPAKVSKELSELIKKVMTNEKNIAAIKGIFSFGIGVVGNSGSGKTTQLNACAKMLRDEYNAICFFINNENDIYNAEEIAKRIDDDKQLYAIFIDGYSDAFTYLLKNILDGDETFKRVIMFIAEESIDDISESLTKVKSRITSVVHLKSDDNNANKLLELIGETSVKSKKIGFSN